MPVVPKEKLEAAKRLNRALILLLLDLDHLAIHTQIYSFGHSIGCVRDCALSLGLKPTAKAAFTELLASLGFSDNISHRLSRDP